jgi:transcriptional regulator with XRE-family HTH domain
MTEDDMTKSWREVRAEAVDKGRIDQERVAEQRARLEAEVRAHRLAEVRKAQGVSQKGIAEAMGVSQPRISKIERGDIASSELGTLRSYVEALGGRLRVVADFGDEQFIVGGPDIVGETSGGKILVPEVKKAAPKRGGRQRRSRQPQEDPASATE